MRRSPLERYHFRRARIRAKVSGSTERPRLSVYRSLKHIYVQVIDDSQGKTLAFASSLEKGAKDKKVSGSNMKSAALVGKKIAQKALSLKIKRVVFDRGGRIYHGCVKAVADSAREGGLEF